LAVLLLAGCAPVLTQEHLRKAQWEVSFSQLRANPEGYRGQLFVLGGIIADLKLTSEGSLLELVHVPADRRGYLGEPEASEGRFLALYPRDRGILDPMIYAKGREVTVAGLVVGSRQGKLGEVPYTYPLLEVQEIYLWRKEPEVLVVPYWEPYWWPDYYYWPPPPYWWAP